MTLPDKRYIPVLDGVRCTAALCVLVGHVLGMGFWPFNTLAEKYVATLPGLGLSLFFVLSGFVIHYNYASVVQAGKNGKKRFFAARFARLYPLYGAVLLFLFATEGGLKAMLAQPELTLAGALHIIGLQSWVYALHDDTSLIYFFGGNVAIAWSISTEFFFYLVYVMAARRLVLLKTRRQHICWAAGIYVFLAAVYGLMYVFQAEIGRFAADCFGAGASLGNSHDFLRWLTYFSPYMRLPEFLLGCLAASWAGRNTHETLPRASVGFGLAALLLLTAHGLIYLSGDPMLWFSGSVLYAPLLAWLILQLATRRSWLGDIMQSRPVVALGQASYSIYLLHGICLGLVAKLMTRLAYEPAQWNALYLALSIAVTLLLALLCYRLYELPMQRWLRRKL